MMVLTFLRLGLAPTCPQGHSRARSLRERAAMWRGEDDQVRQRRVAGLLTPCGGRSVRRRVGENRLVGRLLTYRDNRSVGDDRRPRARRRWKGSVPALRTGREAPPGPPLERRCRAGARRRVAEGLRVVGLAPARTAAGSTMTNRQASGAARRCPRGNTWTATSTRGYVRQLAPVEGDVRGYRL